MKNKKNKCIEEWEDKQREYTRYMEIIEGRIKKGEYIRIMECISDEIIARGEDGYLRQKRSKGNKNGFCKNKYCPVCREIKQKKEQAKIKKRLEEYKGDRLYIFTLSMKEGVKSEEIGKQIKKNNEIFKLLINRAYKPLGYVKTVEISELEGIYNCHIHSILIYKKRSKVEPEELLINFIMKMNRNYSIDFQEIKGKNGVEKVISYITVSEKKKIHNLGEKALIGEIEKIKSTSHKYTYGGVLSNRKKEIS